MKRNWKELYFHDVTLYYSKGGCAPPAPFCAKMNHFHSRIITILKKKIEIFDHT